MLNIKSHIKKSLGYDVYLMMFKDSQLRKKVYYKYYGHTGDIYSRMGVHYRRYNKLMAGCNTRLFETARIHTNSFHEIEIHIIATFPTKAEAQEFEDKMIEIDGNLNMKRSKR